MVTATPPIIPPSVAAPMGPKRKGVPIFMGTVNALKEVNVNVENVFTDSLAEVNQVCGRDGRKEE